MISLKATGFSDSLPHDCAEARRALAVLMDAGQTFELRALPYGRSVVCTTIDQAIEAIKSLQHAAGIYYTLNPCRSGLDKAASNQDILRRRWFLVDIDPVRPSDTSATDAEKAAAKEVMLAVVRDLASCGWPAPVLIDSGNGYHALWQIDLPNNDLSRQWLKKVLHALGDAHDTAGARVDRSVHNAARIAKLPGTWARKGEDTQERPHRMARLLSVPDPITVVPHDKIKLLLDDEHDQPEPDQKASGKLKLKASNGSITAYCRAALIGECTTISLTPEGDRNNQLNTSAFKIGTLLHCNAFTREEAEAALRTAARFSRLGEHETEATIRSGLDAGILDPREIPDSGTGKAKTGKTSDQPSTERPDRLVIGLDEVEAKEVTWLWEGRIAVGFITLLAGRTGIGKSFVICDFASRMSQGLPAPNSEKPLPTGGTLVISEDPVETMLAPRFIELGADRKLIKFMSWEAMAAYSLHDIEMLEQAWNEAGQPPLIVIDPPANFLSGRDEHKNSEIRQVLMGLVAWLDKHHVACVLITHINKNVGKGIEALDRIMGSVAWASTSRITLACAKDSENENRGIFGGLKNNLGPSAEPLSYEIVKTDSLAKIEWHGKVEADMNGIVSGEKRKSRGVVVAEWLVERFREKREWKSSDLIDTAKEAGIDRKALFTPEIFALPIRKRPVVTADGDRFWVWQAKPDWPPPQERDSDSSEEAQSPTVPESQSPNVWDSGTVGQLGQYERNPFGTNTHHTVPISEPWDSMGTQFQSPAVPESQSPATGDSGEVTVPQSQSQTNGDSMMCDDTKGVTSILSHCPNCPTVPTRGTLTPTQSHSPTVPESRRADGPGALPDAEAVQWLLGYLAFGDRKKEKTLITGALSGYSEERILAAADFLKIRRVREDGDEEWGLS